MHSRLENRTIELVKRTQQRINMTLRTHVVSGNTNHPITINHKSRTNHTLINLAIQLLLTIRAIQTMHSQISIRQQRKRQIIALAESDELVQRILRYVPITVNPREERRARLSRKSQASVVQPGVIAAG